ncbi:RNA-directed DNA polymerase, eukaryota [Artemisia annua]|uniref:RNA-directed DNA polymerase, eukaryota n=1 Tax=Artemisia annua TaxID=35608 RepID=A0A2U1PMF9_ARTAN|nr:RNA-directed DNA polymerase, eukaryota [Artemisia annua]
MGRSQAQMEDSEISLTPSFLSTLQNIKTGGLILGVYPTRFDKQGNPYQQTFSQSIPSRNANHQPRTHHHRPPLHQTKNLSNASYRDILTTNTPPSPISIDFQNCEPIAPNGWKKTSIIATAKTLSALQNLKTILQNSSTATNPSIIYAGGLTILLSFGASKLANDFLNNNPDLLKEWFSRYEIWNGQDFNYGRIVTAKIYGVPISLWDCKVFNKIAETMGTLLEESITTTLDENLSHNQVTILVDSHHKINHQEFSWETNRNPNTSTAPTNPMESNTNLGNTNSQPYPITSKTGCEKTPDRFLTSDIPPNNDCHGKTKEIITHATIPNLMHLDLSSPSLLSNTENPNRHHSRTKLPFRNSLVPIPFQNLINEEYPINTNTHQIPSTASIATSNVDATGHINLGINHDTNYDQSTPIPPPPPLNHDTNHDHQPYPITSKTGCEKTPDRFLTSDIPPNNDCHGKTKEIITHATIPNLMHLDLSSPSLLSNTENPNRHHSRTKLPFRNSLVPIPFQNLINEEYPINTNTHQIPSTASIATSNVDATGHINLGINHDTNYDQSTPIPPPPPLNHDTNHDQSIPIPPPSLNHDTNHDRSTPIPPPPPPIDNTQPAASHQSFLTTHHDDETSNTITVGHCVEDPGTSKPTPSSKPLPMNFLSLNIRGIKDPGKPRWVNQLKSNHHINFMCIQETHRPDGHSLFPHNFWGNYNFCHDFIPSSGIEGRSILSMWDPSFFTLQDTRKSNHYLLTTGHINGISTPCNIVNIYAPHNFGAKVNLWNELTTLIDHTSGLWVLLGDFNAVRTPSERKNSQFVDSCANAFNDFIHRNGLLECE